MFRVMHAKDIIWGDVKGALIGERRLASDWGVGQHTCNSSTCASAQELHGKMYKIGCLNGTENWDS